MNTLTFSLVVVSLVVMVLVALRRESHVTARMKLLGVDFSLERKPIRYEFVQRDPTRHQDPYNRAVSDDLTARTLKHLDTEASPVWRSVRGIASRLSVDEKDVVLCLHQLEVEGIITLVHVEGMSTWRTANTPIAPDLPPRKKSSRRR